MSAGKPIPLLRCVTLAAGFLLIGSGWSCKRSGCTDPCAYNYDPNAEKKLPGCRIRKPEVTFWSDGNSHGFITISTDANGSGKIDIGEYFGTLAFGFKEEPPCSWYNTVNRKLDPGTYLYEARGSEDDTLWTGYFTLQDCDCIRVLLKD